MLFHPVSEALPQILVVEAHERRRLEIRLDLAVFAQPSSS